MLHITIARFNFSQLCVIKTAWRNWADKMDYSQFLF